MALRWVNYTEVTVLQGLNRMADAQVVLITGASSGIGHATALAYAKRGLRVAAIARDAARLEPLQKEITALGGACLPLSADVRDREAMIAAATRTVEVFGRLDIAIANAGLGHRGPLADAAWDDLDTLIRTNIDGVLHTIRATVPHLRQSGGGHIVIISSIVWNMVSPYAAAYAASKAFVSSLARSIRFELARDNIRVTDMRVGRTVTSFNANRLGGERRKGAGGTIPEMPPEQVAQAIVRATLDRPQDTVNLRWIDRLIVFANRLAPNLIGRMAARQYK